MNLRGSRSIIGEMPDIFINKKEADREVKKEGMTPSHEVLEKSEKSTKEVHRLVGHSHNPLSSFCYFPDNVKFVAQDSQERIVLFLRRHPITNIPWILGGIIMLFAPAILPFFPILEFLPERFQFIAVVMWYLLTTAFVLEKFLSWFFNVYIVTDERVFDVDFVNLVYREIAESNLDQIQDVNVQMGSVIRTIFNYGEVLIQTASAVPNIEFEAVPQPDRVAKILRELRVEEEQEKIEGRVR